jgi:Zn-dependent M32 family carboxypeptidase
LPFIKKVYPKIQELFPEKFANVSAEDFYRAVNFSKPGLIRIEADELTYSIHVLIRYEIEKMIFSDKVTVADITVLVPVYAVINLGEASDVFKPYKVVSITLEEDGSLPNKKD